MNRDNLKLVILFLLAVIGYFIGSTVYSINFGSNNSLMVLSSIVTSGILCGLYLLFLKKRYPQVLANMKIEQNDEREKMIREKAGHYTLMSVFGLSFGIATIAMMRKELLILFISGGLYILLLIQYIGFTWYFKKKL